MPFPRRDESFGYLIAWRNFTFNAEKIGCTALSALWKLDEIKKGLVLFCS